MILEPGDEGWLVTQATAAELAEKVRRVGFGWYGSAVRAQCEDALAELVRRVEVAECKTKLLDVELKGTNTARLDAELRLKTALGAIVYDEDTLDKAEMPENFE